MAPAAEAPPAHVMFWCEVETFALLMCGRRGWEAALGDSQVTATGDTELVQSFTQWFQGV